MTRPTLHVLVVEPDDSARTAISWHLEAAGYAVRAESDGRRAFEMLATATGPAPQLLLIDVHVDADAMSGLDVLRRIRSARTTLDSAVPAIVTSARVSAAERIAAFEAGADDYFGKPIVPDEFEARVRSLVRRVTPQPRSGRVVAGPEVTLGALRVDPSARSVTLAGRRIELTAREFDLLHFLAAHPGQVFSRSQLLRLVWHDGAVGEATVTEHVHRLRRKLGIDVFATVRRVGYRLDPTPSA